MKNRLYLVISLLALCTGAYGQFSHSSSDEGFYLSVKGAYSAPGNSSIQGLGTSNTLRFKGGYDLSGSVGYHFPLANVRWSSYRPVGLRLEFEGGYTENHISSFSILGATVSTPGSLESLRFMVNGYLDVPLSERFYASIGGGIGYSRIKGTLNSFTIPGVITVPGSSHTADEFAWQIAAGVGYDVTERVTLELGYRLFSYGDPTLGGTTFDAPLIHLFGGGLTLRF